MGRGLFISNSDVHIVQTRQKVYLHVPSSKLTLFQKDVQYCGSKIFNRLPSYILSNNVKSCKVALKTFLLANMLYTVNEFFKRQM